MNWKKEKQKDGSNYYVSGKYSIEPVTGDSYYKWYMTGIRNFAPSSCFRTVRAAKECAEQIERKSA